MEEDFTESMIPAIAHLDCSNRNLIFFNSNPYLPVWSKTDLIYFRL